MLSFRRKNMSRSLRLLLILIVAIAGMSEVKGQYTKVRASYIGPYPANTGGTNGAAGAAGGLGGPGTIGSHSTTNPLLLNDGDYVSNWASINATSGTPGTGLTPGSGGASTSYLDLNFPAGSTPVAGNQVFFKITAASNTSGLLGSLFANPNLQVTVQGLNGSTLVGSASTLSTLGTNTAGYFIFPLTVSCNAVRITVNTDPASGGLLGGSAATARADVYDVYIFDPTCGPPTYTTAAVTGISLGGAVLDPDNAIDADLTTKSTLSVGLLSAVATIKQTIYFSKVSNPGDAATITFSVPAAVLNLGLFNGITLQAYNGATAVGAPIQVSSLLSLDLLGLLGSGTRFTGSYIPSTITGFDRIEISTSSVASVLQNFFVHEVQQTPPKPTFLIAGSASAATICSGSPVTLKADAPGSGNELRWYSAQTAGTLLATANTFTPSPALTTTTTYYVATAKTGCSAESERVPVVVTVNPLPPAPAGTAAAICSGSNGVFAVTSPNALYTYNWYTASTGGSAVLTGTTVTTTSTLTNNLTYYLEAVITATGCPSSTRTAITITVNPPPTTPTATAAAVCSGTNGVFQVTSPNAAYTYNWYTASTGGSLVLTGPTVTTTSTLTSNLTYYLEAVVTATGCRTPARTPVTVTIKPLPTLTSSLIPSVCSNSAFVYNATSDIGGSSFSWTRATTPGISNAAGSGVTNTINETLINTTNAAVTVTYVFNITANGCSTTTNVQLKVNPKPGPPHIVSQ